MSDPHPDDHAADASQSADGTGPTPEPGAIGAHQPGATPADDDTQQLVLAKDGERIIIRYRPGEEAKVLEGLAQLARDPDSSIEWFDAALLSHQVGQRLGDMLKRLHRSA